MKKISPYIRAVGLGKFPVGGSVTRTRTRTQFLRWLPVPKGKAGLPPKCVKGRLSTAKVTAVEDMRKRMKKKLQKNYLFKYVKYRESNSTTTFITIKYKLRLTNIKQHIIRHQHRKFLIQYIDIGMVYARAAESNKIWHRLRGSKSLRSRPRLQLLDCGSGAFWQNM